MKYLQGSFTVGGYSKEGRDNYDRIFRKKQEEEPVNRTHTCGCGFAITKSGGLRWVLCAHHKENPK